MRGLPAGIVTEQDMIRRVSFSINADIPITKIMSAPAHNIGVNDLLYQGLAGMRYHGLRHMPVLNAVGEAVGILQLQNLLTIACERLLGHH